MVSGGARILSWRAEAFFRPPGSPARGCWATERGVHLFQDLLCCSHKPPGSCLFIPQREGREEWLTPFASHLHLLLEYFSLWFFFITWRNNHYFPPKIWPLCQKRGRSMETVDVSHVLCPRGAGIVTQWTGQMSRKTVGSVLFSQTALPPEKIYPRVFALQSGHLLLKTPIFLSGIRNWQNMMQPPSLVNSYQKDEYEWGAGVLNGSLQTHRSSPNIWQAGFQRDLQGTVWQSAVRMPSATWDWNQH